MSRVGNRARQDQIAVDLQVLGHTDVERRVGIRHDDRTALVVPEPEARESDKLDRQRHASSNLSWKRWITCSLRRSSGPLRTAPDSSPIWTDSHTARSSILTIDRH